MEEITKESKGRAFVFGCFSARVGGTHPSRCSSTQRQFFQRDPATTNNRPQQIPQLPEHNTKTNYRTTKFWHATRHLKWAQQPLATTWHRSLTSPLDLYDDTSGTLSTLCTGIASYRSTVHHAVVAFHVRRVCTVMWRAETVHACILFLAMTLWTCALRTHCCGPNPISTISNKFHSTIASILGGLALQHAAQRNGRNCDTIQLLHLYCQHLQQVRRVGRVGFSLAPTSCCQQDFKHNEFITVTYNQA